MRALDQGRVERDHVHQHPEAELLLEQPPRDLRFRRERRQRRVEEQLHRIVAGLAVDIHAAREIRRLRVVEPVVVGEPCVLLGHGDQVAGARVREAMLDLVCEVPDVRDAGRLLQQILHFVEQLAKDRAALKNIKIETAFAGDNELIEGDEAKLSMALLNIIINAIEAVDEHKGVIKLKSNCKDKKCLITIEDNGCGICQDDLNKIFEPYFTCKTNGMGLGLSTTHNIIYSHKGNIEVESEQGKGTRFHIHLDLV